MLAAARNAPQRLTMLEPKFANVLSLSRNRPSGSWPALAKPDVLQPSGKRAVAGNAPNGAMVSLVSCVVPVVVRMDCSGNEPSARSCNGGTGSAAWAAAAIDSAAAKPSHTPGHDGRAAIGFPAVT